MKTPREILYVRHQAAAPKLDLIRREVVVGLHNQEMKEQSRTSVFVSLLLGRSNKLWQELVLPSRRVWSGLAAFWVLIIAVNLAEHDPAPAGKISAEPVMMSLREQQRWMNELFADRSLPMEAERPKTFSPKPRTEKSEPCSV